MGSEGCSQRRELNKEINYKVLNHKKKDLNEKIKPKMSNLKKKGNYKINRKDSLSTNNSEDESNLYDNMSNHQKLNTSIQNLVDGNQNMSNDNNFDEQKARNLVRLLLENDVDVYKDLIPIIDGLSSEDFQNLFEGNCEYNYNTACKRQIKRLAFKFDNFYYILVKSYKENNYYEYLKELWVNYPYLEDLKHLNDDNISSKLSSTLPNYSSWPNNIKQDLIRLIKYTITFCKRNKR